MIEISEIKNRETLKQWLDERPQETDAEKEALRLFCVWLAHRSLMWAFPRVLAQAQLQKPDFTISYLRSFLTTGVINKFPTEEINNAALKAEIASIEVISFAGISAYNTFTTVAEDATDIATTAIAEFAEDLDKTDENYHFTVWQAVRDDCGLFGDIEGQNQVAVWRDENPFVSAWAEGREWMLGQYDDNADVRVRSTAEGVDYRFWVDWYEAALAGKHLNWNMQHEIALIADDVWMGDALVLMDRINGIRNRYLLEERVANSPIGLNVKFDPKKKRLGAYPTQDVDLAQVIDNVRRSLRRFVSRMKKKSKNDNFARSLLGCFEEPISYLRKDISKYSDVPQQVYAILQTTIHELADIAQSEHVGSDPMLNTLLRDLTNASDDICGLASDVRDGIRKRSDIQFERIKAEQVEHMLHYAQGMKADSHGLLKVMTTAAIVTISDEKASDEAKKDAWYFMQAILPRAGLEMQRALDESDDPDLYKKVVKRAKEISTLDKGADAVQEAVAEFGPWFADMARFLSGFG